MDGTSEARDKAIITTCLDLMNEDDLGVVIRGHLRVERELNYFIESRLADPAALQPVGLDYDARVQLALALGLEPGLKAPMKALGKLRNRFAHQLEQALNKSDADNCLRALHTDRKQAVDQALAHTITALGTDGPSKAEASAPRVRCMIFIVSLWAALVAENGRLA